MKDYNTVSIKLNFFVSKRLNIKKVFSSLKTLSQNNCRFYKLKFYFVYFIESSVFSFFVLFYFLNRSPSF